ncbi:MAG TPA: Gfo/Idh/MocA family oxidoreductase [Bryobacteraceae bacterium]|nr:Gfo/Idh/MocA family oxidoreductase [Bryobacteraceae bacterium]
MTELKIGVIGLGYTGRLHLAAYGRVAGARVAAVADTDPGRAEGLPYPYFRDYAEMLESGLDAVSICLPTWLHCEAALRALESGKHVLLEKPVAANTQEARRMLAAARAAGRTIYVGMTHRFYPEMREARRRVEDGDIGRIVLCNDSILEHFGFLQLPDWYLDKRRAGGGAVLTSGIHLVDRLRWFTGDEITEVGGMAGNPFFGGSIEDAAQMFLRFRSGISGQVSFALFRDPHPLVCDLQLIGTRGSLTVHTWKGYEIHTAGGSTERVFYSTESHAQKVLIGMTGEVEEFCRAIREGREPWPSAGESAQALEVIAAFYRAVESGKMEAVQAV